MIKAEIHGGESSRNADVADVCGFGILAAASPSKTFGTFSAATHAAAGTTAIVTTDSGGSIIVTDILVTSEKKQNGTITISFTDGTNSVDVIGFNVNDAPAQLAANLAGKFGGWKDARIDLVTVEDFDVTVTVGYMKISANHSESYADWDAQR